MGDRILRNNAHCTIPDDPELSTYRFIIVAAKRARQLQGGARPVLPTSSKKPTVIAMEEVLKAADRIDRATQEIQLLSAILNKVDKNITAAAQRAVKRVGHWPLRLNSRKAKECRDD